MAKPGTWTYDAAADKWSISVTAEDDSTQKTYTITVNELSSTEPGLTMR